MDERHTEHIDIEVDRCLHVVSAEREAMDAAQSRFQERASERFTRVVLQLGKIGYLPITAQLDHQVQLILVMQTTQA
jgi:hypothetical protein